MVKNSKSFYYKCQSGTYVAYRGNAQRPWSGLGIKDGDDGGGKQREAQKALRGSEGAQPRPTVFGVGEGIADGIICEELEDELARAERYQQAASGHDGDGGTEAADIAEQEDALVDARLHAEDGDEARLRRRTLVEVVAVEAGAGDLHAVLKPGFGGLGVKTDNAGLAKTQLEPQSCLRGGG